MGERLRRDLLASEHPGNFLDPLFATCLRHADTRSPVVAEKLPDDGMVVGPGSDLGKMSHA